MSFSDYSQPIGTNNEIPLQPNSKQELSQAIYKVASSISLIEQALSKYSTPLDSTSLRHSTTNLIKDTQITLKHASGLLKTFISQTDSKIQQRKMTLDFNNVMERFNTVSKLAASKSRDSIALGKQQNQQLVELIDTESESQPLLTTQNDSLNAQIEINQAIIQEREQDLAGLEQSILQVNEIFRDLGTLVNEQQFVLDNIETNVNTLNVNMENATGQLRSASSYQNSSNKRMCWIFGFLLIITLIAVLLARPWRWT